jgi:hypothetical protein
MDSLFIESKTDEAKARYVLYYVLKEVNKIKFVTIQKVIKSEYGFDTVHANMSHGVNVIRSLMRSDADVRFAVEEVIRQLDEKSKSKSNNK